MDKRDRSMIGTWIAMGICMGVWVLIACFAITRFLLDERNQW